MAGGFALRPPQAELHQKVIARHRTHAARFGRDQRFVIHDHRQTRFEQERLRFRGFHSQQHFAGERDRAFRHRVNVPRKTKIGQPL